MTEDQYDEEQERDATIGHAKMILDYITENDLDFPCLCDDLADFINELNNSKAL